MKNNLYLAAEMLTDLPSGFDIKNSGVGKNVRLPKLVEVELLAKQLETQGVISDAYYYYKLIAELYGEEGKKIANAAFERDNFKNYINSNTTTNEWGKGTVNCRVENIDRNAIQSPQAKSATFRNNHAHTILQIARGHRFSDRNSRIVILPFLGAEEPFLSLNSYFIEWRNNIGMLVAYDKSSNEIWRFNLADHFNSILLTSSNSQIDVQMNGQNALTGFMVATRFVKGHGHLLVLVVGNKMIALDTFGCGNGSDNTPRFLWARQMMDSNNFNEKRLTNEPFVNSSQSRRYTNDQTKSPQNEVKLCITKNVICYREQNQLYGVCLLTGNTLWIRDIQTELCSVYGDQDFLFLFDHDTFKVTAIDSFSGMELKYGMLAGNILTNYGTNVLITKINEQSKQQEIFVTDLRDLFLDNNNDIKLCKYEDAVQNELCRIVDVGTLPVRVISLGSDKTIKMIKHLDDIRYVSIATNNSVTGTTNRENTFDNLFIYDLKDKSYVASKVVNDIHEGIKLSNMARNNNNISDFQVYRHGDKFLVVFCVRAHMNNQIVKITDANGAKHNGRVVPIFSNAFPRFTDMEYLMLFDKNGEQCWRDSVLVGDGYLLHELISEDVPVLICASQIHVQVENQLKLYLGISIVDKISGRQRYKENIPLDKTENMRLLKFTIDKENNEIKLHSTFYTFYQTITIKFE
jgi:predicted DNA binding protein